MRWNGIFIFNLKYLHIFFNVEYNFATGSCKINNRQNSTNRLCKFLDVPRGLDMYKGATNEHCKKINISLVKLRSNGTFVNTFAINYL